MFAKLWKPKVIKSRWWWLYRHDGEHGYYVMDDRGSLVQVPIYKLAASLNP